jgi:hypothetical protein
LRVLNAVQHQEEISFFYWELQERIEYTVAELPGAHGYALMMGMAN